MADRPRRILLLLGLLICAGGLPWIIFRAPSEAETPDPELGQEMPRELPRQRFRLDLREPLAEIPDGSAPDPEPPGHALRGRVLDAFKAPISGCKILVEKRVTISLTARQGGDHPADVFEALSDFEGRFALKLAELGPWVLTLLHPDYPPTIVYSDLHLAQDRTTDLGDLQLHSEVGLVVIIESTAGSPIDHARLSLQPVIADPEFATRTQRALRRAAISDPSGRALFYGVAAGTYLLRVESAGFATFAQTHQQAELLQRPPMLRLRLIPGHVLRGQLSSADGEGVANSWIVITPQGGGPLHRTRSAASGMFRFSGLKSGRHALHVASATQGNMHITDIEIPRAEGQLELRFPAGLEIAGVVLRAQDRQPVAGAKVRLCSEDPWPEFRAGERFEPECESDRHGRFRFTTLANERYRIEVTSKGLFPITMSLQPKESADETEVLMQSPCVITGRLIDSRGRALSGGLIEVVPGSYDGSEFSEFKLRVVDRLDSRLQTHSDPEGRFRIDTIPAGEYRLRLGARDKARKLTAPFTSAPAQTRELGDLQLADSSQVMGQALLATGEPAKKAMICLDPLAPSDAPALSYQVLADESGHFRFDGIAAGSYSLFYYYPKEQTPGPDVDYRTRSRRRIEIRAGTTQRQALTLR